MGSAVKQAETTAPRAVPNVFTAPMSTGTSVDKDELRDRGDSQGGASGDKRSRSDVGMDIRHNDEHENAGISAKLKHISNEQLLDEALRLSLQGSLSMPDFTAEIQRRFNPEVGNLFREFNQHIGANKMGTVRCSRDHFNPSSRSTEEVCAVPVQHDFYPLFNRALAERVFGHTIQDSEWQNLKA